jgi:hypothetical protein
MIKPSAYLVANHSKEPLEIAVYVNVGGRSGPFDVLDINGMGLYLLRKQTIQLAAKLAELIAMPEDGKPDNGEAARLNAALDVIEAGQVPPMPEDEE